MRDSSWRKSVQRILGSGSDGRAASSEDQRRAPFAPHLEGLEWRLGGAGANNGSFQGQTYTVLQTFPTVVSINRAVPASSTTNASTVSFAVTFSKPVSGVDPTDFQIAKSGTIGTPLIQVAAVSTSVY